MNAAPYKTIFGIGIVMALRMIGLFMVMPLLALYVINLQHTTPMLIGIALGIYGLTQAFLQIPFGIISDFRGRKPVILIGLVLFILGSLIAAQAQSIFMMITGRALQGAGAVGSTLMALLSDVTDEKDRSQAMAIVGGIIGISFSLAIVLGPALNTWFSVPSIFLLSAVMGIIAIGALLLTLPHSKPKVFQVALMRKRSRGAECTHKDMSTETSLYNLVPAKAGNSRSLKDEGYSPHFSLRHIFEAFQHIKNQKEIWHYNFSSMVLHAILIMNFIGGPILLNTTGQMAQHDHWKIYLPILILSFALTLGWIMLLKKKEGIRFSMLLSTSLIILSQIVLVVFSSYLIGISIGLLLFFLGFNFLEATLPSEISKKVGPKHRGMAMGFYSTTQFTGIFLGGFLGGIVSSHFSSDGVFILGTIIAVMWLLIQTLSVTKIGERTWQKA